MNSLIRTEGVAKLIANIPYKETKLGTDENTASGQGQRVAVKKYNPPRGRSVT